MSNKVQLNRFDRMWTLTQSEVMKSVQSVGAKGWYILGENVKQLESQLARFMNKKYAIGVANGMDAIEISLRALGCKSGDKVLTTPLSAFATTLAILRVGAIPVFVDTDTNGLVDLEQTEKILSQQSDIKFFIPVHLYGACLDLEKLKFLKNKFNLYIIEDVAQALGATWKSDRAGTFSDFSTTSFYPTKNLGALGDGGMIFTDSADLFQMSQSLRNYGQSERYVHVHTGLNSRLDELHAAIILNSYWPHYDTWTEKRNHIAKRYHTEINNRQLNKVMYSENCGSVWHIYPLFIAPEKRASFRDWLNQNQIENDVHYPRLINHQKALLDYFKELNIPVELNMPVAEKITLSEVSIPVNPFLSESEVDHVIKICNQWNG